MNEINIEALFQPKPSKQEAKADVTTRVAREMIDTEVAARDAKTERLRAARLARQAAEKPKPAAKARRKG